MLNMVQLAPRAARQPAGTAGMLGEVTSLAVFLSFLAHRATRSPLIYQHIPLKAQR